MAKPTGLVVNVPTTHAQVTIKTGATTVVLTTDADALSRDSTINVLASSPLG